MNKKNYELNGFNPMPLCDGHIHLHIERPLEDTVKTFIDIKEHYNYEKMALCCLTLPHYDISGNYKAFYYKDIIDGVYANTGIVHTFKDETSEYYLSEIKKYHKMGADGMKMLEGKPADRKMLGKPLDHKDFDAYYAYAEENGIPILMHWGDPKYFWDLEKVPQWAIERGWFYDSSYIPFSEARREVEGFLTKFPKLKITFAHFFFMSDDFDYAEEFLNKWENVTVDLTPGGGMYIYFNADSEKWRDFFIRHSDKILYGTDMYNWELEGKTVAQRYSHAVNLERSFLEKAETFTDPWLEHYFDKPFNLDEDILTKIYSKNFKRIWGANPRPLDKELIVYDCKNFLQKFNISEIETNNLKQVINHFSK